MFDKLSWNMFVEGPCEVAFKQLVIDGLEDPDKLVEKMVGMDGCLREVIDSVSNPITKTALEEGVDGLEDLPGDDDIPLTQQFSSILTLRPPRLFSSISASSSNHS